MPTWSDPEEDYFGQNEAGTATLNDNEQKQAAVEMASERAAQIKQEQTDQSTPDPGSNTEDIQQRISKITGEEKKSVKQAKNLKKELSSLKAAFKMAKRADAIRAITKYVSKSINLWWTIVMAIVDIFFIIPGIYLYYVWTKKTGKTSKPIQKKMDDLDRESSATEKTISTFEMKKRQLYSQADEGKYTF